jgi:hypothetical protein
MSLQRRDPEHAETAGKAPGDPTCWNIEALTRPARESEFPPWSEVSLEPAASDLWVRWQ